MTKNICIALSGKTGCGKSEVAKILVEDYGFKEYSFGEPIRDLMKIALPNVDYHADPRARQIIIDIAEAPKTIAPRCWSYALTERICQDAFYPKIVISDLRFKTELNHLREIFDSEDYGGGYQLYLAHVLSDYDRHVDEARKEMDDETFSTFQEVENDPSNTEHLSFYYDFNIENQGPKTQLYDQVRRMMTTITHRSSI